MKFLIRYYQYPVYELNILDFFKKYHHIFKNENLKKIVKTWVFHTSGISFLILMVYNIVVLIFTYENIFIKIFL